MKKDILFLLLLIVLPCMVKAQYNGYKDWPSDERRQAGRFFLTDEAAALADKVLTFQFHSGAWPKNVYYPQMDVEEAPKIRRQQYNDESLGTIENKATLTEIHFLSNMYVATDQRRYRKAAEQGIYFLLNAQYPNGGWPLNSPAKTIEAGRISFTDGAMVNVLLLLSEIAQKKEPYAYLGDDIREKAQQAFNKGIACILNAQVRIDGKPTIWCSRYDAQDLSPASTAVVKMPALSSAESATIVLLLMGIQQPDPFVQAAVKGAVEWFQANAIHGQKRENYIDKEGKRDFRLIPDQHAADMWSCYTAPDVCKPLFTEQDGELRETFQDLTRERRTKVSWYTNEPLKVLRRYERWQAKVQP